MVASKTTLFGDDLQKSALFFKALSHPARLQILRFLAESRTCLSGDISDKFPLSRTTLNQHMKELKDAGLICAHEEGSKVVYCLDCSVIHQMHELLDNFMEVICVPEDFHCECS